MQNPWLRRNSLESHLRENGSRLTGKQKETVYANIDIIDVAAIVRHMKLGRDVDYETRQIVSGEVTSSAFTEAILLM